VAGLVSAESPSPAAGTGQTGSNLPMLIMLGVVIVLLVLFQRRGRKRQADADAFRNELAPGQRVMTMSGMIGVISQVNGDVITVMSASGDESAWIRRAIRSVVPDDEWEAMTAEYPDEEPEEPTSADQTLDASDHQAIEEKAPHTDKPDSGIEPGKQ
jgi:preprotein translocase subunit YajC